jgi:type I restriction-modification system DNA methylase subunit
MKELIANIKQTLAKKGFEGDAVVNALKDLREYVKANLNEPGYVKMIRLAYENIEENGEYTYDYLRGGSPEENLNYFLDLLADHKNKYNKEELQEIRNLMEGLEVDYDDFDLEEEDDDDLI